VNLSITAFVLAFLSSCGVVSKEKELSAVLEKVHHNPCLEFESALLVESSSRIMHLCKDKKTLATYFVGLGSEGAGKTRQGDKKTPLGTYTLGRPRASSSGFNIFIHVGYPTSAQRKQGYTGGNIGVHGPQRDWREYPQEYNVYGTQDWTLGCIAVGSDKEIEEIADLVNKNNIRTIVIQ